MTGASSGIGLELSEQLAARGSSLVLVARRHDVLQAVAADVRRTHGVEAEVLRADLSDPDDVHRVEERLRQDDRPVDCLVNNAGFGTGGRFATLDVGPEAAQVAVHCTAVLRLTHAALARMVPARHGGILNVASVAGFLPLPGAATYAACKAWMLSFTEAVHEEVRRHGVHVTALAPGFTRTPMMTGGAGTPVPDRFLLGVEGVARSGLDALARNRAVDVPSAGYKLVASLSSVSPRWLVRALTGSRIR